MNFDYKLIISRKNGKNYCEIFKDEELRQTFTIIKQAIDYIYKFTDTPKIIDKR